MAHLATSTARLFIMILSLWAQLSCAAGPVDAKAAWAMQRAMEADPKPLRRPVVVIGGYGDPGFAASHLRQRIMAMTGDDRVIQVAMGWWHKDFDHARQTVLRAVSEEFGDDTIEVDVVGVSMGGLVARYAALPHADGRSLRAVRLFTLSSPHQGARLARIAPRGTVGADMRVDAPFIQTLNAALPQATYELTCYVRLGDELVGSENAAPPGHRAWWVPTMPLTLPHGGAPYDPRIVADLLRRLRGEEPLFTGDPPPLPD